MRQVAASHRIKGIAPSGYETEADVRASREAGSSGDLTRPVDLDALLSAITDVSGGGH
jgi:DNA-binding NarL/FixJ family response regulator